MSTRFYECFEAGCVDPIEVLDRYKDEDMADKLADGIARAIAYYVSNVASMDAREVGSWDMCIAHMSLYSRINIRSSTHMRHVLGWLLTGAATRAATQ